MSHNMDAKEVCIDLHVGASEDPHVADSDWQVLTHGGLVWEECNCPVALYST